MRNKLAGDDVHLPAEADSDELEHHVSGCVTASLAGDRLNAGDHRSKVA